MSLPAQATASLYKHKFLGLNYLRVFAITYVFLFHYQIFGHPDWVNRIGQFGWTGVDLFCSKQLSYSRAII